ncbi:NUDIX domain-containing protein [Piscinibacter defluvii]|uniref:NUDIX domain-containing protein n=1 Tax=Piscinibacter defluvii TaxID=1796922 RepID=UPI000FDF1F3A|nr:NUDIX domain-containing protein [Piscinibacter defluvii]
MPTPEFIRALRSRVGHELLHVPTVGVLAHDGAGRILLVQDRDDGQWTCPGGIVEPFELPADAALREAWEETGVEVRLTGIVGIFGGEHCGGTYANGDRIAWVATIFSAQALGDRATPDGGETSAACFMSPSEIARAPLKPHLRLFLDALASGRPGYFQPPSWSQQGDRPGVEHTSIEGP